FERDDGGGGVVERGGREKRGDLRGRRRGFVRPAGVLPNVREGERRLRRRFGEKRRLLRACDEERLAACRGAAESLDLGAAELGMHDGRLGSERGAQRTRVERHRRFAVADENPLRLKLHLQTLSKIRRAATAETGRKGAHLSPRSASASAAPLPGRMPRPGRLE